MAINTDVSESATQTTAGGWSAHASTPAQHRQGGVVHRGRSTRRIEQTPAVNHAQMRQATSLLMSAGDSSRVNGARSVLRPGSPSRIAQPQPQLIPSPLASHAEHGLLPSPRGWHQQWKVAAASGRSHQAPSSSGCAGHLADVVIAEYDALDRHMEAVHARRNRKAAGPRRGLKPVPEGRSSRPRSPGSAAQPLRRWRPQTSHLSGSQPHRGHHKHGSGGDSHQQPSARPQTPTQRSRKPQLPVPLKGRFGRVNDRRLLLTRPASGYIHAGAQDFSSQIDWPPSPVIAALLQRSGSADGPAPSQLEHQAGSSGRASMLRQLESVHQLADAIAERLSTRMAHRGVADAEANGCLTDSSLHSLERGNRHMTGHAEHRTRSAQVKDAHPCAA